MKVRRRKVWGLRRMWWDGKTNISEFLNRFSCSVRVEHYHVGNVSGKILHHKVGVVSAELPLPNATTAHNKCRQGLLHFAEECPSVLFLYSPIKRT